MANDLNSCSFIGRLGRDPEVRYLANGDPIASFSLAVGSQWKDKSGEKKESTEWVNITAFGKLAEICSQYLTKGSQVFISGRMKTDEYEKDGIKRYSTKIIADKMQMLGGNSDSSARRDAPTARQQQKSDPNRGGESGFDDFPDDIPF